MASDKKEILKGIYLSAIGQVRKPLNKKLVKKYLDLAFNFKPNSVQLSFLYSPATIRCLSGANSVGKTEIAVVELHAYLTGFRPYMLDLDGIIENIIEKEKNIEVYINDENTLAIRSKIVPLDDPHERFDRVFDKKRLRSLVQTEFVFSSARYLVRDLQHIGRTVVVPKLKKWIYPWIVSSRKNQVGVETYFELGFLDRRAVLDIVTDLVPDPLMLEGWSGEIIIGDEPLSRDAHVATIRGLREENGRCWYAFTPLREPWMYFDFKRNADGKRVFWEEGDIAANLHNLRKGYLEDFASQLTEDEKSARLHGKAAFLSGLVFRIFNRSRYVLKEQFIPPCTWPRWRAIDVHGMRKPQAVLYVAISPDNKAYVYHEIWEHRIAKALAKDMIEYQDEEIRWGCRDTWESANTIYLLSIIDPFSSSIDPITNTSFADELITAGILDIIPGSKDKDRGNKIIQAWLEDDRIRICPSCTRIQFEFERYSWKDPKPTISDGTLNKPIDKDNDMLENLRRILLEEPRFVDLTALPSGLTYDQFCNQSLEF